jgi:hypothetical protein
MEKKDLINILSEILVPIGFKRKGNYWVVNGDEITKMVNLQKSQYGNFFYINYDYILNALPLGGLRTHVGNRVSSLNKEENLRIDELLDLENNITDEDRIRELKEVLQNKLVSKIQPINTEEDLSNELKKHPQLQLALTLAVKRHLNLVVSHIG